MRFLIIFEQWALHFHFSLRPASSVACLDLSVSLLRPHAFPLYLFLSSTTVLSVTQNHGGVFTFSPSLLLLSLRPACLSRAGTESISIPSLSVRASLGSGPHQHRGIEIHPPCSSLFLFNPFPSRHTWAWPVCVTKLRSACGCGATPGVVLTPAASAPAGSLLGFHIHGCLRIRIPDGAQGSAFQQALPVILRLRFEKHCFSMGTGHQPALPPQPSRPDVALPGTHVPALRPLWGGGMFRPQSPSLLCLSGEPLTPVSTWAVVG